MDPQLQGQLRSLIISLGSIAGTLGYLSGVDWVSVASAVVTVGGFIWSWYSNRTKTLIEQAAQSPEVKSVVVSTPALAESIPSPKVVSQ